MTTIGPFGMAYRHRLVQILLPWMMLIGIVAPLGCGTASNGHNVEGVSLYKQGQYHAALLTSSTKRSPAIASAAI